MTRAALLSLLLLAGCQARLPWAGPATAPGVRVEGNEHVHTGDLLDVARPELEAYRGNGSRPADADDAAYAMEALLRDRGHPEADVTFEAKNGELLFKIEEGPRAHMGCVRFEGVKSVPESALRPYFDFDGSGFLGLEGVLYQDFLVDGAMSDVESFYLRRGFYRVEVGPARPAWNEGRTCMDVVVPVAEGARYVLTAVTATGVSAAYLAGVEPLVGGPFRARQTVVAVAAVRKRLYNEGYAFARVTGEATVADMSATASIHIVAERGALTRIGRICVRGQKRTKTRFLRRLLPLHAGQVLRREKLNEGVGRMFSTGVLRSVQPDVQERAPGLADVYVDVEEGRARSVDLRAGWGSYELAMGSVTYRDLNFLGRARVLDVTGSASVKGQGIDVIVEDPWILGDGTLAFVKAGVLRRDEPFYDYRAFGVTLAIERRFAQRYVLRGGYRLRGEEASNISSSLSQAVQDEIGNFSRSAGLFAQLRSDTRDDPFVPTRGSIAKVGVFWSTKALGASLPYLEVEAELAEHLPLGSWGVVMIGAHFATRSPLEGQRTLPVQLRYFLGGSETVRSFNRFELTPIDGSGEGLGGLTALHGTLEWRRTLVGNLQGALFYDAGVVSIKDFDLGGAFGHGFGGGLRYILPIGPVRLDYAYNPGDLWAASRRWQLHLSFGFNF